MDLFPFKCCFFLYSEKTFAGVYYKGNMADVLTEAPCPIPVVFV